MRSIITNASFRLRPKSRKSLATSPNQWCFQSISLILHFILRNLHNTTSMKLEKHENNILKKWYVETAESLANPLKIEVFWPPKKSCKVYTQKCLKGCDIKSWYSKIARVYIEWPTINCLPLLLPNPQQSGLPMQVTTAWGCGFRSQLRIIWWQLQIVWCQNG